MSPTPPPTPPTGGREGEDRVERTFNSAIERPAGERLRFVDEACKDDAELGERVRRLLAAYERAGENLDQIVNPELQREFARLKPEETGLNRTEIHFEIFAFARDVTAPLCLNYGPPPPSTHTAHPTRGMI